jgi:hypothetical protein
MIRNTSVYIGFKGLPQQGPIPFVPDTRMLLNLKTMIPLISALRSTTGMRHNLLNWPTIKDIRIASGNSKTTIKEVDTTELHYVKGTC